MSTRAPLQPERLSVAAPWTSITVLDEVDSTNLAVAGQPPGTVIVAEHQRAGRGRLNRSWVTPPRAGLLFSAILRPSAPPSTWAWLPLLTGLALTDVIAGAVLKWPNDAQLGPQRRKIAGILAQATGEDVIIGVGLNVSTTAEELPVDTATSLAIEGHEVDRSELLGQLLSVLGARYLAWEAAGGAGPLADYRERCATIGQAVRVHGVDGSSLDGSAVGVDENGRLIIEVDGVEHPIAAGDVEHLRPVT